LCCRLAHAVPRPYGSFGCPLKSGVCSNGIPGIESANGEYCCPATCGECDASDCTDDGTGCCGVELERSGVMCDDSEAAPCIIDTGEKAPPLDRTDVAAFIRL